MARPYANDLRRKFLQAYEQGKGTLGELAEQFGVSQGWAKKISAPRTRTGQIERPPWRRGPVSRVTNRRSSATRHCRSPGSRYRRECLSLVLSLRIWSTITLKML